MTEAVRQGAGAALQAAAMALLGPARIGSIHAGRPVQAAFPHVLAEVGGEADWGHKSGVGREVRLAVTVRDEGERPDRVHRIAAAAEAALEAMPDEAGGWRIVTFLYRTARIVREGRNGWAARIEYRARMLRL